MKKIVAILILSSFSYFAISQEVKPERKNNGHHIGVYAGASSGYGISYRYFLKGVGFQITTTPIIGSDNTHLSIGGMVLFSLNRTEHTNLFGYVGHHYRYDKEENYYYYDADYSDYERIETFHSTGIGVGFELDVANRIGFNWHLGYAYYNTTKDDYYNGETNDWRTFIDAGTGIFYKF